MTSAITFGGGSIAALDGLRQAERAVEVVAQTVASSTDPNLLAQAATLLQGAQGQSDASALALRANLEQQRYFIDILA